MESSGKADYVIQQSGCGRFQVLMVLFVYMLLKVPSVFTMMFMSFGSYNPGWTCLDNGSFHIHLNETNIRWRSSPDNQTTDYRKDLSCQLFKTCQHVEFDPGTSTIVTEWGLICDKAWISSLIISIQMAGMFVGSFVSGQLGDTFGRKKTLYASVAIIGVASILSINIPYWQVYIAMRFIIGSMVSSVMGISFVFCSEFLSINWRGRMAALPAWNIGGLIFAATAMLCKDWKLLHLIEGAMYLTFCTSAFWAPESLRWLEVKNKTKKFDSVARKIANINNDYPLLQQLNDVDLSKGELSNKEKNSKKYTILDVFHKGYKLTSLIIGLIWFSPYLIYFAVSFGVKSMYGNFYINLIILFAMEIPFSILPVQVPNMVGRKLALISFIAFSSLCLYMAMGFELWTSSDVKHTGTLILALLGKTGMLSALYVVMTLTSEIYPTVIRSNTLGYGNVMARLGGIIAPFLIPQDPDTIYICYAVMGSLGLLCCLLATKLPETRGKKLKEFFEDD